MAKKVKKYDKQVWLWVMCGGAIVLLLAIFFQQSQLLKGAVFGPVVTSTPITPAGELCTSYSVCADAVIEKYKVCYRETVFRFNECLKKAQDAGDKTECADTYLEELDQCIGVRDGQALGMCSVSGIQECAHSHYKCIESAYLQ